jgi:DnaJ-class molecular chaperone|tara:strand:- start:897 stop:1244 length:348 start_codon:yes stop_codon:yes gene_type:complete
MRFVYILLPYLIDGFLFSNSMIPFMIQKNKADIEIAWNVYNNIDECDVENITSCAVACDYCDKGEILCNFCKGTGFFIIGNELIGTNNTCPACKGKSYVKCTNCGGSGYIANWKK